MPISRRWGLKPERELHPDDRGCDECGTQSTFDGRWWVSNALREPEYVCCSVACLRAWDTRHPKSGGKDSSK